MVRQAEVSSALLSTVVEFSQPRHVSSNFLGFQDTTDGDMDSGEESIHGISFSAAERVAMVALPRCKRHSVGCWTLAKLLDASIATDSLLTSPPISFSRVEV
jgi:hypothetical protein